MQESCTPGSRDRALRRYRYSQRGNDSTIKTRNFSSRIEIGTVSLLLSAIVSFACFGTSKVTVKFPVSLGFHTSASLVRPCGAMRTSLVTSSPFDVRKTTDVEHSRGSVLSIVKGIRTDLPTTAKVGASTLSSSTSGNRCGLPTGTVNTGTLAKRNRTAASTGGSPWFQSPSEISTTPASDCNFSAAAVSGEWISVPLPAPGCENACTATLNR